MNQMNSPPLPFKSFLAWRFTGVEKSGILIKKGPLSFADFPVLTPMPTHNYQTKPLEIESWTGPYLYFLLDRENRVCLIGSTQASGVFKHWISTGIGGKNSHYWAHLVGHNGWVGKIADSIRKGDGPYTLRYVSLVRVKTEMGIAGNLKQVLTGLLTTLSPLWGD